MGLIGDECDLALTLRKGDLFVLSWARVRRMKRGSISTEMPMCGGVRNGGPIYCYNALH